MPFWGVGVSAPFEPKRLPVPFGLLGFPLPFWGVGVSAPFEPKRLPVPFGLLGFPVPFGLLGFPLPFPNSASLDEEPVFFSSVGVNDLPGFTSYANLLPN